MKSTINSIRILIKIFWKISNNNQKIKTLFILTFSVISSLLQYINITLTALTFSFITSLAYSEKNYFELEFLFGNTLKLQEDSLLNLVSIWVASSLVTYLSVIISSISIYKLAYFFGKKLTKILLIDLDQMVFQK